MDELQGKLDSILNNPQMMQQIMSLAKSLNQSENPEPPLAAPVPKQESTLPDMTTLARIGNLAKRANIDKEQQMLLRALSPYLGRGKLNKLERAMQAAQMAKLASSLINNGGLQFLSGR